MLEKVALGTVEVANEVDGIEMGILAGGAAYLTGRGVARLCDVAISTVLNQKDEWSAGKRNNKFAKMLQARGFDEPELFIPIKHKGQDAHAYPEVVCMTFLEYFAFESPSRSKQAETVFRKLAMAGIRIFVYTALGYDPQNQIPQPWREFHDRLIGHRLPPRHFSVFREMSDFILSAIRAGLRVDHRTIPDISVGQLWGKHWSENKLDERYGFRRRHDHNYPDYFPQAKSNPQEMWVYPVDALPEFRRWLEDVYIPTSFGTYLKGKVKQGLLATSVAELLLVEVNPDDAEKS